MKKYSLVAEIQALEWKSPEKILAKKRRHEYHEETGQFFFYFKFCGILFLNLLVTLQLCYPNAHNAHFLTIFLVHALEFTSNMSKPSRKSSFFDLVYLCYM